MSDIPLELMHLLFVNFFDQSFKPSQRHMMSRFKTMRDGSYAESRQLASYVHPAPTGVCVYDLPSLRGRNSNRALIYQRLDAFNDVSVQHEHDELKALRLVESTTDGCRWS
jgi:hypothetical protein